MSAQQPSPQPSAWIRALAAIGGLAIIGAAIVLSSSPVAAAGLERFAGCGELQAHLEASVGDARWASGAVPTTALPTTGGDEQAGGEASADGGGTNTQVAGIDELDLVEALADGRTIVVRNDRIVLVDAAATKILATLDTPGPTQITMDDARSTLWAVSDDGQTTTLIRSVLDGNAFTSTSTWQVAGRLVDLRRNEGRVHLVVVDDGFEVLPVDVGVGVGGAGIVPATDATVPFKGTSPVPCDQVLHSPLPSGPASTLVATFDAAGELSPVASTEIVGAGDNVLVTDDALYVSTPVYDDAGHQVTGIHRFDLDGLALTGSGSVSGRLLNQFSLDEYAGHLRAAVTIDGGGIFGGPTAVEGGVGEAPGGASGVDDTAPPETATTVPPSTDTTVVEPVPPSTDTTVVEPVPTVPPSTDTTVVEPVPTVPPSTDTTVAPTDAPLNEIVTFDLDGALDVVGRSPRFGHVGETLQGIRFAGDVAYAVTFLQTDPLYVLDLSDPVAPTVLGQVEVPGFSAYLHPISPTQVVGFGPGGEGQIVARLFDTSDPATPRLLDTVDIGEDSPILYDHHALRAEAGRLILAANAYVSVRPADCGPLAGMEQELNDLYRQLEALYQQQAGSGSAPGGVTPPDAVPPDAVPPPDGITPAIAELQARIDALTPCVYPATFPQARIVLLAPDGSSLQAQTIETDDGDAQRVVAVQDGYLIVGSALTSVGADGATRVVLDPAEAVDQPVKVNESTSASNAGA